MVDDEMWMCFGVDDFFVKVGVMMCVGVRF